MSSGSDLGVSGANSTTISPSDYTENGEILIGKLVITWISSIWLTTVAGWITLVRAIVEVNTAILLAVGNMLTVLIRTVGWNIKRGFGQAWAEGFQAAVATSRFAAPLIFTLEILAVTILALAWRRRVL